MRLRIAAASVVGAIIVALVLPTAADAAAPVQPADGNRITNAEDARNAATSRWAQNYGYYRSVAAVSTYQYGPASDPVFVTHGRYSIPVSDVVQTDPVTGLKEVSGAFRTVPVVGPNVAAYADSGSATWQLSNNECQTREENGTGWIDGCWQIWWLNGDNDAGYDYYAWKQYATASSKGIYTLHDAFGSSSRESGSTGPWSWVDWNPQSDMAVGNCSQRTIGVSYIAEISATYQVCDTWDISKSSTPGTFSNYWRGSAYRSERAVAHMTLIKTPTGNRVSWWYDHGFHA